MAESAQLLGWAAVSALVEVHARQVVRLGYSNVVVVDVDRRTKEPAPVGMPEECRTESAAMHTWAVAEMWAPDALRYGDNPAASVTTRR